MNTNNFVYGSATIVAALTVAFILYCNFAPIPGSDREMLKYTGTQVNSMPESKVGDAESAAVYSDLEKRLKKLRE